MAGVTAVVVKEELKEIAERLRTEGQSKIKEKLQVLYWLKQQQAPSISEIALAIGKHRSTVQRWLTIYEEQGLEAMLEQKHSKGRTRIIPKWAEKALEKRLQEAKGFKSYGQVQEWLAENLGVKAQYHAVYQMTRYRLKAKLKVARPQHSKQDKAQLEAFKKTLEIT